MLARRPPREAPIVRSETIPLRLIRIPAAGLCLALGVLAAGAPASSPEAAGTVYLVRHGETEGEGQERRLSAAGRARAEALADRLAGAGIEAIHTTDYRRTRETAAPLAERLGLHPRLYDPDDLPGFAARLRMAGGTVLVVGHSNTTPELVEYLGGEPGSPITEDEHDRLYRVELPSGETELSRFGPALTHPPPSARSRSPSSTAGPGPRPRPGRR